MPESAPPHASIASAPESAGGEETFDYTEAAELFTRAGMIAPPPADASAQEPSPPVRTQRRKGITYRRFATGAEAIRFAIEDMPAAHLLASVLVVNGDRHEPQAIRALYASADYPLARRARGRSRVRPKGAAAE